MLIKMLYILLLIGFCISTVQADEFEFFTRAIDERDKQVDIYAPHTVLLSQLYMEQSLVSL